MISITKVFRFEAAHAISDHPGQCRHVHGHSYELHVSVHASDLNQGGMIMDFHDLKSLVQQHVLERLDHALILNQHGALAKAFSAYDGKLFWMDEEPTAENLVKLSAKWIGAHLPDRVSLKQLQLWETATSYAQWEPAEHPGII